MNNELYHHGILGQKWGVRRFQNKDGSYTNAGKKRRNQSEDNTEKNEKVKRAAKTGAVVCGVALAAIGGTYLYKTGRLDGVIDSGKDIFENTLNRKESVPTHTNRDPDEGLYTLYRDMNKLRGQAGLSPILPPRMSNANSSGSYHRNPSTVATKQALDRLSEEIDRTIADYRKSGKINSKAYASKLTELNEAKNAVLRKEAKRNATVKRFSDMTMDDLRMLDLY